MPLNKQVAEKIASQLQTILPDLTGSENIAQTFTGELSSYEVVRVEDEEASTTRSKTTRWLSFGNKNKKSKEYTYYVVDYGDKLGHGGFGVVYKAYRVKDTTTGTLDLDQLFAVKQYDNTQDKSLKQIEKEAKDERKNSRGLIIENPVVVNNTVYMFMEYISGEELNPRDDRFRALSFAERVEGLYQLASQLNVAHHYKPTTGSAVVHADIKPSNIKIDYEYGVKNNNNNNNEPRPTKKKIQVRLLDYGVAENVYSNPNVLVEQDARGTFLYMAPESKDNRYGVKTDIFLFSIIMLFFFGASDPLSERRKAARGYIKTSEEVLTTALNPEGLFEGITIPSFVCDIKPIIEAFTRRAMSIEPEQRPDSDETLTFFTTLSMLCKVQQDRSKTKDDQCVYLAKLALLATDSWNGEVEEQQQQLSTSNKQLIIQNNNESLKKTWATVDFEENVDLCKTILLLHDKKLLTKKNAFLLLEENAVEAITKLDSEKLLDKHVLKSLMENPTYCGKILTLSSCKIAYLFLVESDRRQQYLQDFDRKEQLKFYRELSQGGEKYKYMGAFGAGKYFGARDDLVDILMEEITQYRDRKALLKPGEYEGWRVGHTNGEKREAADLLLDVFSGRKTVETFFSPVNKGKRKALSEPISSLKQLSGIFVEDFIKERSMTLKHS